MISSPLSRLDFLLNLQFFGVLEGQRGVVRGHELRHAFVEAFELVEGGIGLLEQVLNDCGGLLRLH